MVGWSSDQNSHRNVLRRRISPLLLSSIFLLLGSFAGAVEPSPGGPALELWAPSLQSETLQHLYTIASEFKAQYAPFLWKKKHANWELNAELDKALAALKAKPNLALKESQSILSKFVYSTVDYHTSISFYSTEENALPFIIQSAGDRFYFVWIDRTRLTPSRFPYQVGDEVATIDGRSTADVVRELRALRAENVAATDQALAERYLTRRRAARGYPVPHGPVSLGIRKIGSANIIPHELMWDYTPEKIFGNQPLSFDQLSEIEGSSAQFAPEQNTIFHPMMTAALVDRVSLSGSSRSPSATETPFDLGSRKTFTPDLGTKIWESEATDTFYAYIFSMEKTPGNRKVMGYVRIGSYVVKDYVKAVSDFSKIIERFQSSTDSMIIDQVNNPGGSVFYLYALASYLSPRPLATPLHRMTLTQSQVNDAFTTMSALERVNTDEEARAVMQNQVNGYPVDYEFAKFTLNFARFLADEWIQGHRLTDPWWIGGVRQINPAPNAYSKPILVLVNHLDFSGGDFFPAILQDNHRARIMGSRTAGAGGYVLENSIPNTLGVDTLRITGSIAARVDGNPIENLGVTPEAIYEMTAEDYAKNYEPYIRAIRDEILKLTP